MTCASSWVRCGALRRRKAAAGRQQPVQTLPHGAARIIELRHGAHGQRERAGSPSNGVPRRRRARQAAHHVLANDFAASVHVAGKGISKSAIEFCRLVLRGICFVRYQAADNWLVLVLVKQVN